MDSNKINNLTINPDAKASRFVVDLKKDLPKEEVAAISQSRLEKLSELDYGKMLKKGKERTKSLARSFWIPAGACPRPRSGAGMTKTRAEMIIKKQARNDKAARIARNDRLIDQLAFVQLGRLLFRLFYKICFIAGWLIMFILRLFYFIFLALTWKKFFYWLFVKSRANNTWPLATAETPLIHPLKEDRSPPYPPFKGGLKSLLKPVLIFAAVLLAIVLPVKAYTYYKSLDVIRGRVLGASETAISDLLAAGQSAADFDFNQADQSFTRAGENFLKAQDELNEINGLIFSLASIMPDDNLKLAAASPHLLKAGELSAGAGKNLSLIMESFFNHGSKSLNLTDMLASASLNGHNALTDLSELNNELNRINADVLPENYQKTFILIKLKTGELQRGLKQFISLADGLKNFLGASLDKRYLLVFQNNAELRASGGFIGSYAIIDLSKGEIKNIEVPGGGSYDTDAGLLKKIKAPEPLSLVRADWHFWDANWWPDWPTSARKLAWFYENSDGSTVDGVISFTPTVMEKLLKIIGPIDLREKYGLIIDADNFWLETQKLSEQKPDVTREPKKIIGDLMNKIIEELPKRLGRDNLAALLKTAEESLNDKNILLYFSDSRLKSQIAGLGWDGKIKETAGDYLNVVNTNIAGGKSDRKIKQEIFHQARIQPDGTIIDSLTIKRAHEAVKGELFTGVRNIDWLRIYVPAGSELIEASGFAPVDKIFFETADQAWPDDPEVALAEAGERTDELSGVKIYNELGKTVFANWSQVDPGQTAEINIKYKLPFKLTDKKPASDLKPLDRLIDRAGALLNQEQKNLFSYSLLAQKQPGMNASLLTSELKLNGNFKPLWRYPEDLPDGQNGWLKTENFDQDKLMGIIAE